MPYIGNPIYQSAFVVDQFSGNGSTTAFTMSVAPAGVTNVLVAVSGVLQDPSTYGVVGNTITFSAAPPSGTGNISCRYLGVPASGVTTTAYRTVTEFTATAGQTTFTPPSYNVGFINVYLNGVLLGSADYTATNGTTVVLAIGASAGNLLTVESFQISSVANAISNSAGSVSNSNLATGAVTSDKIASSVTLTTPTLTTPTIAGNGLINQSWTTAGRPASPTTGAQGFNTTLNVPENYNSTNGWVQGGMYLTGSANIASGSPQAYIDIANCFNTTFQNYVVKIIITNGATTSGGEVCCLAYESTGASLSGGLFSGGTFPTNFYWVMRYQQTNGTGTNGNQGGSPSTTAYPEIFGSLPSSQSAGAVGFIGTLNLYDVYASSIKFGDAQGTMNYGGGTCFLEQSNFNSASAMTGRGLRLWIGDVSGGSINTYGTVKVYGVL